MPFRQQSQHVGRFARAHARRFSCTLNAGSTRDFELQHFSFMRQFVEVPFYLIDLLEFSFEHSQFLLRFSELSMNMRHPIFRFLLGPVQGVDLLLLPLEGDLDSSMSQTSFNPPDPARRSPSLVFCVFVVYRDGLGTPSQSREQPPCAPLKVETPPS